METKGLSGMYCNNRQCKHCWKCGQEGHVLKSCQNEPRAGELRCSSAQAQQSPNLQCCGCGKQSHVMKRCSRCQAVQYCSKSYQKEHYANHKVLCKAIKTLEDRQAQIIDKNCQFQSHITPKQKVKLVSLV